MDGPKERPGQCWRTGAGPDNAEASDLEPKRTTILVPFPHNRKRIVPMLLVHRIGHTPPPLKTSYRAKLASERARGAWRGAAMSSPTITLAGRANRERRAAEQSARTAIGRAIECGRLPTEARTRLGAVDPAVIRRKRYLRRYLTTHPEMGTATLFILLMYVIAWDSYRDGIGMPDAPMPPHAEKPEVRGVGLVLGVQS